MARACLKDQVTAANVVNNYCLKKGVFLHAFFDESGLVLYDSATDNTVQVRTNLEIFEQALASSGNNDGLPGQIVEQLLQEKMIVPV